MPPSDLLIIIISRRGRFDFRSSLFQVLQQDALCAALTRKSTVFPPPNLDIPVESLPALHLIVHLVFYFG